MNFAGLEKRYALACFGGKELTGVPKRLSVKKHRICSDPVSVAPPVVPPLRGTGGPARAWPGAGSGEAYYIDLLYISHIILFLYNFIILYFLFYYY